MYDISLAGKNLPRFVSNRGHVDKLINQIAIDHLTFS